LIRKPKRFDRRHFEITEQIPRVADAVRIAHVAQLGGSSLRIAEVYPFDGLRMEPLAETLDDLASEWSGSSEEEDRLVWSE